MKKSSFLFDANVVIKLHEMGMWEDVIDRCDVELAKTVVGEARFWEDSTRATHPIDLSPYEKNGKISVYEVDLQSLHEFEGSFDPSYIDAFDPGEVETLVNLLRTDNTIICSADHIVFKVLGNLSLENRGISLEELMHQIGLTAKLPHWFRRKSRMKWISEGISDRKSGLGRIR
jgi:hypothetical protein